MRGVFWKLLAAFLLVIAAGTLTLDFTIRGAWEKSLQAQIERAVTEKTRLFAYRVEHDHSEPLRQIVSEEAEAANARATVIDVQGRVLADSEAIPESMENHATRPEFAAALRGQTGMATRTSRTVGIPFLYVAAPVPGGGAVRMAYPLSEVRASKAEARRHLLVASGAALLTALVLAAVISQIVLRRLRRIVVFAERIAAGDLTARIAEHSSDEIATVASSLDRTARRLEESFAAIETSRRQLETLLNSMSEAVIAIDDDGKVLWANGPMQRLAGGVRQGAPVVESLRDPNFLAAVENAIDHGEFSNTRATALAPGRVFEVTAAPMPVQGSGAKKARPGEKKARRFEGLRAWAPERAEAQEPDGGAKPREFPEGGAAAPGARLPESPGRQLPVVASPHISAPPSPARMGAVAVLHDLTGLERVEKTRRDFIANVSHELRTPLTSVQGYAETLLDSPVAEPPNVREFLQIILRNAARMSRLTEDLLVLARVESGEQRFSLQSVFPADLLQDVRDSFAAPAQEQHFTLVIENSAASPVLADREAIHQVFGNLIRNAMNYSGDGGIIELGARPVDGAVEFHVRDFGRGIASEHLPRLFERFYRVDKARSRESGGTGLGLAIVKHIVLAHGGQVRAESRLGHGSTFYFTIPVASSPLPVAGGQ
jgi:two-component system phosphate regulon sensor histidine kinase PhoR